MTVQCGTSAGCTGSPPGVLGSGSTRVDSWRSSARTHASMRNEWRSARTHAAATEVPVPTYAPAVGLIPTDRSNQMRSGMLTASTRALESWKC